MKTLLSVCIAETAVLLLWYGYFDLGMGALAGLALGVMIWSD